MGFQEELEEVQRTLKENAHLKREEFKILYDSQLAVLQDHYPQEYADFWKTKENAPLVDKKSIRYILKSIL